MIEVQLITSGKEDPKLVKLCRDGLNSPVVNVHEGERIDGNPNAARIAVWDTCGGDLLSFVDPEDIPSSTAWNKLQDVMDQNPTIMGAYTLENIIGPQGNIIRKSATGEGLDPSDVSDFPRHILVVRRSLYELARSYVQTKNYGIGRLLAIAAFHHGGLVCIKEFLYSSRRHYPTKKRRELSKAVADDFVKWLQTQS